MYYNKLTVSQQCMTTGLLEYTDNKCSAILKHGYS